MLGYNPNLTTYGAKTSAGELLKMLRVRSSLTQAILAEHLNMSEKMVRNWETGSSLPKAESLRRLVEVYYSRAVFVAGQEREEARQLWHAVKAAYEAKASSYTSYPQFDETWFATLLPQPTATPANTTPEVIVHRYKDWGEAPASETFYGRDKELAQVEGWLTDERCRLVGLFGMGGIGKTAFSVYLTEHLKHNFEVIIWRSLRNAPPLELILSDCLKFLLQNQQITLPEDLDGQLSLLVEYLRGARCLLVLDNFEAVLQGGEGGKPGHYLKGFEGYGKLVARVGETGHQSCLLLTSREKPREFLRLEGHKTAVRSLQLNGLEEAALQKILEDRGLSGTPHDWQALISRYSGNPLALKFSTEIICELFNGDISAFLRSGNIIFEDVSDLLDEQFKRLTPLEKQVMFWLAIERTPTTLETLCANMLLAEPSRELLDALSFLRRRYFIEVSLEENSLVAAAFTQQPVVMEYVTQRLVEQVFAEIVHENLNLLASHALLKAQARENVRLFQGNLILQPLLTKLNKVFRDETALAKRLLELIANLKTKTPQEQGYAGGNLINLLCHLRHDLSGYDFAGLNIWQAYLRGVELRGTNFSGADLSRTVFTDNFNNVLTVAFSPDGKLLASGDVNGAVHLWQVSDGQLLLTFKGHTDWVEAVDFHPGGEWLASSGHDGTIRLWEISSGRALQVWQAHTNWVGGIAFSPDGKMLASASKDFTIKLWEVPSGRFITTLARHANWVWSVAFSPDGKLLASGSDDQTVRIWDVASGAEVVTLCEHNASIWSVAFSPDGKLLASGSFDRTIRIWDVASGQCNRVLAGHSSWVGSVAFSPDSKLLVSGSEDKSIRLWDVGSGACFRNLQGHSSWVRSVVFSPDGATIVSGSDDQSVKLWEVSTGVCYKTLQGYTDRVRSIALSPDSQTLVSGGDDQMIRLWDIRTGQCVRWFSGHSNPIFWVTYSPDGKLLASGSYDRTIKLWDVASGANILTLQGHNGLSWSAVFSPDSRLLALGGYDQTVRLWDIEKNSYTHLMRGHSSVVWSVVFSPDGQSLASSSDDRTIRIWDVASGSCRLVLRGHNGLVWPLAYSPNGNLIASGSDDQTVRLWDVASASSVRILNGHTERVRAVAFSPDGSLLASGAFDYTVRLWDVASGEQLHSLAGHREVVRSVVFTQDGKTLLSGSEDGNIKFWDVASGACFKVVKSMRPYEKMNISGVRGLTAAQKDALKVLGALGNRTC